MKYICILMAGLFLMPLGVAAKDYKLGDRLQSSAPAAGRYQLTRWEELVPKGWDPSAALKGLDLSKLNDADPRAMDALRQMTEAWNAAPIVSDFKGKPIRIAGFLLPLERKGEEVLEFLLVPYFGACIHSPPPPANQIIRVIPSKPVQGLRSMEAVWVNGTLDTVRTDSPWGAAGYQLQAQVVELYRSAGSAR